MVVVPIETTELLRFLGALQLSTDKAELRTVVRLNAQATIGPQLPLAAEPVRGLHQCDQAGGSNRAASVVIVQVGFSTNLARLLDSSADAASPLSGRDLAARKVRLLSMMAGNFAEAKPEYNVQTDIPSARKLFRDWPTPIVASGYEVGASILYPASSIENDFSYTPDHPIAEAYRNYMKMPYDRPTWDLTAALYAIRPDRGYFTLSPPGAISVDARGITHFTPGPGGSHRFLTVDAAQRARALDTMVLLASQPPGR